MLSWQRAYACGTSKRTFISFYEVFVILYCSFLFTNIIIPDFGNNDAAFSWFVRLAPSGPGRVALVLVVHVVLDELIGIVRVGLVAVVGFGIGSDCDIASYLIPSISKSKLGNNSEISLMSITSSTSILSGSGLISLQPQQLGTKANPTTF